MVQLCKNILGIKMIRNENEYYIVGIDGGATKTRGVLLNDSGETLAYAEGGPTNLTVNTETAPNVIQSLIHQLCEKAKIPVDNIDALGLGLAGSSDKIGRDVVFKKLDEMELSRRTLIANDAEAAYEVGCPTGIGFLVTVSTGVICLGRDEKGNVYRTGGLGHDAGDKGSGFWMGKELLLELSMNEGNVSGDSDLEKLMEIVLKQLEQDDFIIAVEELMNSEDTVPLVASLAKPICEYAEKGNEVALKIVQKATSEVAELIKELTVKSKFKGKQIVISGNGSVISNEYFRHSLNDALFFDFPKVTWTFSNISPAYGSAILASKLYDINLTLSKIVKQKEVIEL
jgi:N-acetylglucosamine kinase-like BadF-type ATPase